MDKEHSKLGRLFDVRFVKRLLWQQDVLPSWVLWLLWWPLPWLRLGWIQEVTGQLLVMHSDAKTGEVLDYTWQSARGLLALQARSEQPFAVGTVEAA